MAVINVCELWRGRTGSWGEDGKRSWVRIFRVKTDSIYTGSLSVLVASGGQLPRIGDPYQEAEGLATDLGARCRSLTPNQTDDPWTWEVVANYDNEAPDPTTQENQQPGEDNGGDDGGDSGGEGGGEGGEGPGDPTLVPAEFTFTWEQGTRVLELVDPNGNAVPVVNSANQTFDPPVEIPYSHPVIICSAAQRNASLAWTLLYQDAVNSDRLQIRDLTIEPGQAKVRGISIAEKHTNGITYDQVTIELELNFDYWNPLKILDQGFYFLDGADWSPCVDVNGDPLSQPALLDGNGGQLAANGQPVFIDIDAFRALPFKVFGIFTDPP